MARVQRFPAQLSVMVSGDHDERMRAIERANQISLGDVVREIIEAGLPSVEARYAAVNAE